MKEAFGEVRIPILRDVPFFHELTIEAAGRVADYKGDTGTVFAWNAGGTWAPIPDIRFRGNYSRAVRAPNLSELFSVQTQNFDTAFLDPCSSTNIGAGSPDPRGELRRGRRSRRYANCSTPPRWRPERRQPGLTRGDSNVLEALARG